MVTKSDERFGAIFECPLLQYVRSANLKYIVVGGWNESDTYDAGRLIPYLEANPAFERVYATPSTEWPRVLAIYQVVGTPAPIQDPPLAVSGAAYTALDWSRRATPPIVLSGEPYRQTVQSLFSRPPQGGSREQDEGAEWAASNPERCPATLEQLDA